MGGLLAELEGQLDQAFGHPRRDSEEGAVLHPLLSQRELVAERCEQPPRALGMVADEIDKGVGVDPEEIALHEGGVPTAVEDRRFAEERRGPDPSQQDLVSLRPGGGQLQAAARQHREVGGRVVGPVEDPGPRQAPEVDVPAQPF